MTTEIQNLVICKKERAILRTSVDKYIDKIKTLITSDSPDLTEIELLIEQLDVTAAELKKINDDIKILFKEEQLDSELDTAEQYREKIICWRFKANKKIKEIKDKCGNSSEQTSKIHEIKKETPSLKLPKLTIAKFSGNPNEWLSFWNLFSTTIHDNKNLENVEKFSYLKSFLSGCALRSIEGFSITDDNYLKCIELLKENYGNKDTLIQNHLNNIINLQPLKFSRDVNALKQLYDKIQIDIRSLESLGINIDTYENLLAPIILKLLPKDFLLDFHKQYINKSYTSIDILSYLHTYIAAREKVFFETDSYPYQDRKRNDLAKREHSALTPPPLPIATTTDLFIDSKIDKDKQKCGFCLSYSHLATTCPRIVNMSYEEKLKLLRKRGMCYRCLQMASHVGKNCFSKITCRYCSLPHNSIMCNRRENKRERNDSHEIKCAKTNRDRIESDTESKQTLSNYDDQKNTCLQTLIAHIKGDSSSALIRIIIDTGSEKTYLSKYIANELNLKKTNTERIKHGLFGGIEFSENHSRYQFTISSLDKKFSCKMQALDQDRICNTIQNVSDRKLISALEDNNVFLSDVSENRELCLYEHSPEEIHLLLGADFAGKIFTQNVKYLPRIGLTAFGTKLGWVVMGEVKKNRVNSRTSDSISALSLTLHVSNAQLENLWRLDALGISNAENKNKSDLQEEVQNYFLETVNRDDSGRFEISLPWVVDPSELPSNRSIAESALFRTNKKLIASQNKQNYSDIFDSWESEQIIESVADDKTERVHFLPHRPVIKESSETTKMRPVFNASAHEKNSPSLNDCLTKGPNLIELIPRILNRFRKYRIGISSDIEKAFLQIQIREKDRDFLRFLWFDREGKLKVYRHCRVVFGLTSSPFLLVATIKHLLSQVQPHLIETAQILENSFYIDNSLTSLNSEQEINKFKDESISILASGHFNLRCWRSNIPLAANEEIENEPKVTPVLGLIWDLENDTLRCKVDEKIKVDRPYTKRKILSIVQKIFDPIGFTAPVVLIPKLILQKSWVLKLKWDEELPADLSKQFNNWIKGIDLLSRLEIPRWLSLDRENEKKATLHIFSDASKVAYATCAFIRIETLEGVKICLVSARSRVSPLKELTIPRLELLSCLIGARIAKTVSEDLGLEEIKTIFWSDSTSALGWIRREQAWGTYVHNRVSEIRKLSKVSDWRHVPGTLNPADVLSRGCSFEHLGRSKWWEGPSWLYFPEDTWPQSEEPPDEDILNQEKRKGVLTLIDTCTDTSWYKYFSSYIKIVRMFSWVKRFIHNIRNPQKNLSANISAEEFELAEKVVLKLIQKESFSGKNDSKIKTLAPLEDENGILRVKTSIINRNDYDNFRYPILLPSAHPVVEKLIFEYHIRNHHAGVGILVNLLRENFWILKARKTVRNIIRKCVKCQRHNAKKIDPEPGVPPEDRVRDAAIFEVVGTDIAGPLYLSDGTKAYIVLYTCALYRALHLELISSLSTETFLQSFRRFIARRGRPYIVYSDNGSNYLGAANALSTLDWDRITAETAIQKIKWKFNPPAAPWWGGWWERLVRIVKEILRRSLGRASLNYEELNTILCDIEHIVNSRPITYMSEDDKELTPLSPLMFLQEISSSGVPDIDELDTSDLNRRAKYIQNLRKNLRDRFRKEYLGQLRLYSRKNENLHHLSVGDIVLLEDTSTKRINWPLAKVIQVYPGKDGTIRLAKVQTQNGTFLRPVQRLYGLELCNPPHEDQNTTSPKTEVRDTDFPSSCNNGVATLSHGPRVVTRSGRVVKPPQKLQFS